MTSFIINIVCNGLGACYKLFKCLMKNSINPPTPTYFIKNKKVIPNPRLMYEIYKTKKGGFLLSSRKINVLIFCILQGVIKHTLNGVEQ